MRLNCHKETLLRLNRISYKKKWELKKRGNGLWYVFEILRRLSEFLFNNYLELYKLLGCYPSRLNGNSDIIVSLTSFPQRINVVWGAIDSMFHQTIQPSKICLYLSKEEFPNKKEDLPDRLLGYEQLGLEICFCDHNLMPHKKYYYALQGYPDKCVITIDDDIYYQNDIVQNLMLLHNKFPNAVCANKFRKIIIDSNHKFAIYNKWISDPSDKEFLSFTNIAIGAGGVLYPPSNYNQSGMFEIDDIKRLSLKADDLWLKIHETLNGIMVAHNNYIFNGLVLRNSNVISLSSLNVNLGGNDIQWEHLCAHYGVNFSFFNNHSVMFDEDNN